MISVSNKGCIRRLSRKSMKASRSRNLVAIAAIALTTLLFTALFTVALSINAAFQDANFRQAGGFNHGTFKYLTQEQYKELRTDSAIKASGLRRFLGMPQDAPFNKEHVEICYSDSNDAHYMYCDPIEGGLPAEGTDEAAADKHVLELLGVEPELGAKFTMSFLVDGIETTQSFTLCGWWEHDEAMTASHVLVPESRVNAILSELQLVPPCNDGMTGTWSLEVMLSDTWNIEKDMLGILARHGYQNDSRSEDAYIAVGVNWGYTGSQLTDNFDPTTAVCIIVILSVIILTGYLIIYNVFQISVVSDIRFYGMLKTIGATPRQLGSIIRRQALTLSLYGIPAGLVLGWLAGVALTPVIVGQLDGVSGGVVSASPLIFAAAALFSLFTVLLSCRRPGKMAARVSPIEALRYTEGEGGKRKSKRSGKVSLWGMALANLGRSRGKTAVTILSLSLAVLLLTLTVTFTNGFDMDKYVADKVVSDFVLADSGYFRTATRGWEPVPEELMYAVLAQGGVTEGGRVYADGGFIREAVTEEYYRALWAHWTSGDLDWMVDQCDKTDDGRLLTNAQLYGMEGFALDRLRVTAGDISALYESGSRAVAAVYDDDDYGQLEPDSHWAKVGDEIELEYVDEVGYYDPETGEEVDPDSDEPFVQRVLRSHTEKYTVVAEVIVPSALSYRYFSSDRFVMNSDTFKADTGRDRVMLYAFNTVDAAANAAMESFLQGYTENQAPDYDYESKAVYVAEFESFRAMFLLLGGALSFIVGLVGVLNFFNAVLTGILTRRREFAMEQSIGMTGRQLKTMLIYEGLMYALGAIAFSLALTLAVGPLLAKALEGMFWFYSYRLTLSPILILLPVFALLGILLPLGSYRLLARQTIVERLREAE